MDNLETQYKINEQGMIVEVIEKLQANESEQKVNPPDTGRDSIPGEVVHQ